MQQGGKERYTAKTEAWKPVPGYAGFYSASTLGRLRREPGYVKTKAGWLKYVPGGLLKCSPGPDGYPVATLSLEGVHDKRRLHIWIALSFHGAPDEGAEVRHRDGNKRNCAPDNLIYGTSLENSEDCARHGRFRRGLDHQNAVLTDEQVNEIRALGHGEIGRWADRNGVSRGHVYNVRIGHRR